MSGEITVQVNIVVGEKPVNAAVFAEIRAGRRILTCGTFAAGDDACHKFVAELYRLAGGIGLHIPAELDDLAGTFVPENNRAESERVAFVFMSVGTAYAAAFHSDENLVIIDFRDGIFSEFKFTGFDEIREFCHFSHFYSPVLFILLVFRGSHIPENLLSYAVKYITVRRKYKNIPRTKTGK